MTCIDTYCKQGNGYCDQNWIPEYRHSKTGVSNSLTKSLKGQVAAAQIKLLI